MKGNIYLTGFMGSGKTSVGRELARLLRRTFVDMDQELEKQFNRTIRRVFAEDGEKVFRERERALLRRLAGRKRLVVATGGGVPQDSENVAAMIRSGIRVYLDVGLEACEARVRESASQDRPLWGTREPLRRLFERRLPAYRDAEMHAPGERGSPLVIAREIVSALFGESRFTINLEGHACRVLATGRAWDHARQLCEGRETFVLTDSNVGRLLADRDGPGPAKAGAMLTVKPGDRSKNLRQAEKIYHSLLQGHFTRDSLLMAVGGGMVTDLGAFVAGTFKRGMSLVLVSTTLVGCVDAAIGGKAAVNLGTAKNVVGCFTTPETVVLDLMALTTLARSHRSEGLVEAYKTGLVADRELADLVETQTGPLMRGDLLLLGDVARRAARAKAQVVEGDFRESHTRMILNFGHTFGHAVESFHRFRVSHGKCVSIGMGLATEISLGRDLIHGSQAERMTRTLRRIAPYRVELPPEEVAWDFMRHDKKNRNQQTVFVLTAGPGKPLIVSDVSREEFSLALRKLRGRLNG